MKIHKMKTGAYLKESIIGNLLKYVFTGETKYLPDNVRQDVEDAEELVKSMKKRQEKLKTKKIEMDGKVYTGDQIVQMMLKKQIQ